MLNCCDDYLPSPHSYNVIYLVISFFVHRCRLLESLRKTMNLSKYCVMKKVNFTDRITTPLGKVTKYQVIES